MNGNWGSPGFVSNSKLHPRQQLLWQEQGLSHSQMVLPSTAKHNAWRKLGQKKEKAFHIFLEAATPTMRTVMNSL
jgi:hypothetical protein